MLAKLLSMKISPFVKFTPHKTGLAMHIWMTLDAHDQLMLLSRWIRVVPCVAGDLQVVLRAANRQILCAEYSRECLA